MKSHGRLECFRRDPIGFAGEDLNLYRYVGNRPIARIDPSGLVDPRPFIVPMGGSGNSWGHELDWEPRLLDGRSASYDIGILAVLPDRSKWPAAGAGAQWQYQFWQLNNWSYALLTSDCEPKSDSGTIIDVVNIGDRDKIPDQLAWIWRGDVCFAVRIVKKKIGFNTADWTNVQGSFQNPSPQFVARISNMRGPTTEFTYLYTYLKKENCECCPLLKYFLDYFELPDGERLTIPGVGTWTG